MRAKFIGMGSNHLVAHLTRRAAKRLLRNKPPCCTMLLQMKEHLAKSEDEHLDDSDHSA
jgi:hypothetical protein